jgi:raffinose/stachyose/melibiose transport system substrate-binding protein
MRQRSQHGPRRHALGIALTIALAGMAGCAAPTDDDVVQLDFFQFKPEAVADFEEIVADFEAENPDIDVVTNTVPDPDTAIRALLVKGRTPDVLTLNGSGKFGLLAKAGVFRDFAGDPLVDRINPAAQEILTDLGQFNGEEVNGLAFSNNANGIIYNREIFAEHDLEVPRTWDELIEVCDALQAAGVTPFYGTLADGWTALPALNALGAYVAQDGFFDQLHAAGQDASAAPVSFRSDWAGVLDQEQTLFSYAQEGYRGRTYDDGNAAFAHGEVAMLMQGVWAVSPIKAIEPDVDLGVFPYPGTDDPADTLLVSGVDVAVAVGRDTPHPEEAMRFVEYLFRPETLDEYAASQSMFSTSVTSDGTDDPALAELQPYFDAGRITGFVDHQIPPSIPLDAIVQQSLFDADADAALATLDNEWRKVAARTYTDGD